MPFGMGQLNPKPSKIEILVSGVNKRKLRELKRWVNTCAVQVEQGDISVESITSEDAAVGFLFIGPAVVSAH